MKCDFVLKLAIFEILAVWSFITFKMHVEVRVAVELLLGWVFILG